VNRGSTSRQCRVLLPVHNVQKGSGAQPASNQKSSSCCNFCPEEGNSEFFPYVGSGLPHFTLHLARKSKMLTIAAFRISSPTTNLQLRYRKPSSRIEPEAPGLPTSVACRSVVQGTTHISKQHAFHTNRIPDRHQPARLPQNYYPLINERDTA